MSSQGPYEPWFIIFNVKVFNTVLLSWVLLRPRKVSSNSVQNSDHKTDDRQSNTQTDRQTPAILQAVQCYVIAMGEIGKRSHNTEIFFVNKNRPTSTDTTAYCVQAISSGPTGPRPMIACDWKRDTRSNRGGHFLLHGKNELHLSVVIVFFVICAYYCIPS